MSCEEYPPAEKSPSPSAIGKTQGAAVGIVGILSAAIGLVALLIAARFLSVEDNTRFSMFWAVMFFTFGIMTGLTMETTRAVAVSQSETLTAPGKRPLAIAAIGGIVLAALIIAVGGTLPLWRHVLPTFDGSEGLWLCLAIFLGLVGYTGQGLLVGTLAGMGRWSAYAAVIAAESMLRFALLVTVAVAKGGLVGFALASALAEYAWLAVLVVSRPAREALRQTIDLKVPVFAKRAGMAMLGQGASALLLVGFPWLLGMTTPHKVFLSAAPVILAISLTRAPLMVPVTAFQAVAVSYFARRKGAGVSTIFTLLGVVVGVGIIISGAVWAIGPPLLRLIRPEYAISGAVLFGLTMGATCIAMLTLTGVLCQANARYRVYLLGWALAIIVAILVLSTPYGLVVRVIASLVIGPLVGVGIHLSFLAWTQRSAKAR